MQYTSACSEWGWKYWLALVLKFLNSMTTSFLQENFHKSIDISILACPDMVNALAVLPSDIACVVDDMCLSVQCCTNMTELEQGFTATLTVDPCNYKIDVRMEKFEQSILLFDYDFGAAQELSLFGFSTIRYVPMLLFPHLLFKRPFLKYSAISK